jgi:chemotaxis family two-component system sensor kinase Cph1
LKPLVTLLLSAPVCRQQCLQTHEHISDAHKASLTNQVTDFFLNMFDTSNWPARWHCGTWTDFHGWVYIISDLAIWASYFLIPVLLIRMITKRKDVPFLKIFWLFGAFIILCGITHLIDAAIFWWPAYRLSAFIRFLTALISVFTVIALYKVLPRILLLRNVAELEHEINERKAVEVKLEANEIALNNSLELLSQHNQQLKNFTHILSHNIRNHASNISLLTGLLDTDLMGEEDADIIHKIKRVSEGLNTTLNDLSAAIKIRESVLKPEIMHFKAVTQKVITILDTDLQLNKAVLDLDFKVETVSFPGIYLESILMNLISNSVKYRKDTIAPRIKICTYKNESGHTVLEHTDNGIGIDLILHGDKIFGLYKTFHQNKNANGVGLFLVKNQIESQGGQIIVESSPDEGATFKIIFNE